MARTRPINTGSAQAGSLATDAHSTERTGLRPLLAAAVRDGDDTVLRELQQIEAEGSRESGSETNRQ
jgi:hypothetical protein